MHDITENQHPCGSCAFSSESVWQPIACGSVSMLARGFSRVELGDREILYHQGSESGSVYCVSKGLIGLRTHHVDGTSTLMRLAYPGEIIGLRSFLKNSDHQTEAQALLPSNICSVAQRNANSVVQANPTVMARLASRCVDEIDRNHKRIIATATTPNKQRLINLLLRLMKHHGKQDGDYLHMHLPLSRVDLADLLGVQPETLSRLVGRLEEGSPFSIHGRDVQMLMPEANQKTGSDNF